MTTVKLVCGAQDCGFKTPEVEAAIAWGLLQYHRQDSHAPVGAGGGGGGGALGARQATFKSSKKLDRPNLDMDTTEGEWGIFEDSWSRYKRMTGLHGRVLQLAQEGARQACCSAPKKVDESKSVGEVKEMLAEAEAFSMELVALEFMAEQKTSRLNMSVGEVGERTAKEEVIGSARSSSRETEQAYCRVSLRYSTWGEVRASTGTLVGQRSFHELLGWGEVVPLGC